MGKYRYLFVFTLPVLAFISFRSEGIWAYLPVLEAFVAIPLLELAFAPDRTNLSKEDRSSVRADLFYDFALRAIIPFQLVWGYLMLESTSAELSTATWLGRVLSYGIMCGVIGINVAHELGHKRHPMDQFLAKVLLTTSLYTHFFLEHNFGHHRNVGTPEDPSTARRGEWVYLFWFRSITQSYLSAWRIGIQRSRGQFWRNEMIHYTLVQAALLGLIFWTFDSAGVLAFFLSAFTGWILLETVQYIEHYGLQRARVSQKRYEDVRPVHSWNSNHLWGRAILFELSRHSDHHYLPHKNYPELDHHEESPQLPTGYPGMMLLSLIPPLYFRVVHPRIEALAN